MISQLKRAGNVLVHTLETLSKRQSIQATANIGAILFMLYWYVYRMLWGTSIPENLLQWRTNITPDNSLSIVILVTVFFIFGATFYKTKYGFFIAGSIITTMSGLGIFYYELIDVAQWDNGILQETTIIVFASIILIRMMLTKEFIREYSARLFIFVLVMSIPYLIWHFAGLPYGFYYIVNNATLVKTPYFNDSFTHLWSMIVWIIDSIMAYFLFRGLKDAKE